MATKKKSDSYQRILLIIVVLYSVFVGIKNAQFLQIQTIFDITKTSSTTMIVAIGLLVVMISGGIDVSFMSIALFGSYTSIFIMIQAGINNLFFAFIYNVLGIPLAALGLLSPVVAGAAMAMSSISVLSNALRLKKTKIT